MISYSLFMFLWSAAVSASWVSSPMKLFLSDLALLFTSGFCPSNMLAVPASLLGLVFG